MSPEIVFFAKYIEKELGIVYSEFNYYQLQNRLEEIVRSLNLKTVNELFQQAQKGISADLKQLLLDVATNNETSFFRDPKVFRGIQTAIFPKIMGRATNAPKIRIWSAACSNGQEPYTVAMMAKEFSRSAEGGNTVVEIIATDISARVLEKAKAAKYSSHEVQRGLSSPLLTKYFEKVTAEIWKVSAEVRAMVQFQKLNLLDSFDHLGEFDLILCRNVLIYQNVANKAQILNRLAKCLTPQGTLILGAGESMIGLTDHFETFAAEEALFYRLNSAAPASLNFKKPKVA